MSIGQALVAVMVRFVMVFRWVSIPQMWAGDVLNNAANRSGGRLASLHKRVSWTDLRPLPCAAHDARFTVSGPESGVEEIGQGRVLGRVKRGVIVAVQHVTGVVQSLVFGHGRIRSVVGASDAGRPFFLHFPPQMVRHAVIPVLHDGIRVLWEAGAREDLGEDVVGTRHLDVPSLDRLTQKLGVFVRGEQ